MEPENERRGRNIRNGDVNRRPGGPGSPSTSRDTVINMQGMPSQPQIYTGKRISKVKICVVLFLLIILTIIFFHIPRGFKNRIVFGNGKYPYGDVFLGTIVEGKIVKNKYDFIVVADRDEYSYNKKEHVWTSVLISGTLTRRDDGKYELKKNYEIPLKGLLAEGTGKNEVHRGMELSALKRYNNRIYTCCDRTGIVYEILPDRTEDEDGSSNSPEEEKLPQFKLFPRYILSNGDGYSETKGFKCEWISEKDGFMYVGSIGKEYHSSDGQLVLGDGPMYVKRISREGYIEHVDWSNIYNSIRDEFGPEYRDPGYIVHEAVEFNSDLNSWFFLPRRVSSERYNHINEMTIGAKYIVRLNDNLRNPRITTVNHKEEKVGVGYSDVKFIPGRPLEMIALRTYEPIGTPEWKSYLTVITTDGEVLLDENEGFLANEKLEGIEIWRKRESKKRRNQGRTNFFG